MMLAMMVKLFILQLYLTFSHFIVAEPCLEIRKRGHSSLTIVIIVLLLIFLYLRSS